jgi:hypothetical protein
LAVRLELRAGLCRAASDEREVALMCRCLEQPQAVSGVLMSAATYNQPFRF